MVWMSPLSEAEFLKVKITPNLTYLELSSSYLNAEPLQIISIDSFDQLHTRCIVEMMHVKWSLFSGWLR